MNNNKSRSAVIDIGSNSVRLVVYAGHKRARAVLFNEKVLAGLGSSLAMNGSIDSKSFDKAINALKRFQIICSEFQIQDIHVIATAAVRDANNGSDFVSAVREIGLDITIIDGFQEAEYSAFGVMSAFPDADGIMADLGGGSLELAEIKEGQILQRASLPMGVLRIQKWFDSGFDRLDSVFKNFLKELFWEKNTNTSNLYLVGGSWRALARVDMDMMDYPLRVVDHYNIDLHRALQLGDLVDQSVDRDYSHTLGIQSSRIKTLPQAAALLKSVSGYFKPQKIHISAYGLREGILYSQLDEDERKLDPLLLATEEFARTQRRFHSQKSELDDWISPIFQDETPSMQRIRKAFCNLGDVAWKANPDFRAEWGLEIGMHGNWTAITGSQRDILGQALFSCFGGGAKIYPDGGKLASKSDMKRAIAWGLAARLAQRLSGGRAETLSQTKIMLIDETLYLNIHPDYKYLCGETVIKRLNQLAHMLKCECNIGDLKV